MLSKSKRQRKRYSAARRKNMGRPRTNSGLILLTFKADPKTIEALEKLKDAVEATITPGELPKGVRSTAIRKAILEAAERLDAQVTP